MRKFIYLAFIILILNACMSSQNKIVNKIYYHTYLFSTMGNEYGKGGGQRYVELRFESDSVKMFDVAKTNLPKEDGERDITRTVDQRFATTYSVESDKIYINNKELPLLKISGDTLIAPEIKIREHVFQDVIFTLHQQ